MHLSLSETVSISPRKFKGMSSHSSRFTSPLTYAAGEPRNIAPLKDAYSTGLGPGSYDTTVMSSGSQSARPQFTFKSQSPRLLKDPPPGAEGGGGPSVSQQKAWTQPRFYMAKGPSGRSRKAGPQLGSYEGMNGLGRVISPTCRSPDKEYSLDRSVQKRPLSEQIAASTVRYSMAFRSHAARLEPSVEEKRALEYSQMYDPSASSPTSTMSTLGFGWSRNTHDAKNATHISFGSESPRFPSNKDSGEPEYMDTFAADRKAWSAIANPLTCHSARVTKLENEGEASPGPGTYNAPRLHVWQMASPHQHKEGYSAEKKSARTRLET